MGVEAPEDGALALLGSFKFLNFVLNEFFNAVKFYYDEESVTDAYDMLDTHIGFGASQNGIPILKFDFTAPDPFHHFDVC